MKLKRPLRAFTDATPQTTALTLRKLMVHTSESDRGLRTKLKNGAFKGAYRTSGGSGEWRIPLRSLNAYQKARTISPEEETNA